jgi:predicted SprT family Zn-dependent metalloprotease
MEDKASWWTNKQRTKPTFMILCEECKEMQEITGEEYTDWWREKKLPCKKCGKDITNQPRILI